MSFSKQYCLRCEMPGICQCGKTDKKFSFSHKLRPPKSTENKVRFRQFLDSCPEFGNMVSFSGLEEDFRLFLKSIKHSGKLNGRDWYAPIKT